MASADFEIRLSLQGDSSLRVALRFAAGDGTTARELGDDLPLALDTAALLAASGDMQRYGHLLSDSLFADQRVRGAWDLACQAARGSGAQLRVCLRLDPQADMLHSLYWEALFDPARNWPIAQSTQNLLARYLDPHDNATLPTRRPDQLRALLVAASPFQLQGGGFQPIDVEAEVRRVRAALGSMRQSVLARPERQPTLQNLYAALDQERPDIIYIACHGVQHEGQSYLLLEKPSGETERVPGVRVAQRIEDLTYRPLLVVLAVCHSGGTGYADAELAALGPRLVRAGVPAVVAMRGTVPFAAVEIFAPALFEELRKDGQIDRAVAVARNRLADAGQPWWMPSLMMRVRDGALWQMPAPAIARRRDEPDFWREPPRPQPDDRIAPWQPAPTRPIESRAAGLNAYKHARDKIDAALFKVAEPREGELRLLGDLLERALQQARLEPASAPDRHLIIFEQARLYYLRRRYSEAEDLFKEVYFHFVESDDGAMVREIEEFQHCIEVRRELEKLTAQGVHSRERQARAAADRLQDTLGQRRSPVLGLLLQLLRQMAQSPADQLAAELQDAGLAVLQQSARATSDDMMREQMRLDRERQAEHRPAGDEGQPNGNS